jgi:hypothetical protein
MEDKRVRDLFLYIGIAFAVVGIAVACAIYTAQSGIGIHEAFAPTTLFFMTIIIFGWLMRDNRAHLKTIRFWMILSFLFVVHLVAGALVLRLHLFDRNDLLLILIILAPEYLVLKTILKWCAKDRATPLWNRSDL